jgi:hypothetical protein
MYNIYKMNLILYVLIGFFTILIFSQIMNSSIILEGMKNNKKSKSKIVTPSKKKSTVSVSTTRLSKPIINNKSNLTSDAFIISQKNSGDIEYLKGRMNELNNMDSRINKIQQNVDSMQLQMDDLVQQQANYAQELAGNTPPTITGTESMNTSDFE